MRVGDLIKIGRTVNLARRLRQFESVVQEVELLAVEPGDYDVEARRHRQFRALRVDSRRELFSPGKPLMKWIADLALVGQ